MSNDKAKTFLDHLYSALHGAEVELLATQQTVDDIKLLIESRTDGKALALAKQYVEAGSLRRLGQKLGITGEAARLRLRNAGIKSKPAGNARKIPDVEIRAGLASLSSRELAEKWGVSGTTVYAWRRGFGIPAPKRAVGPGREVIESAYHREGTLTKTADALGVSYTTLNRWMRKLDIPRNRRGRKTHPLSA